MLIERGAPGGDIYLVERGTFEVVDRRSHPEIVLAVIGPGTVVGELAFADDSPRTADVRAAEDAVVLTWDHRALLARFEDEPDLAACFYRAVSDTATERLRRFTSTAVSGALHGNRGARRDLSERARDLATGVLDRWLDADERLRRSSTDPDGNGLLVRGLRLLLQDGGHWLTSLTSDADRAAAGALLSRELRPYLLRSVLGERALDPLGHVSGDPRLLAHIVRARPAGAGAFGEALDAALLDLPTAKALRARRSVTVSTVIELARSVPGDAPTDVLLAHPNCGAVLAGILNPMSRRGTHITIVDGSHAVLGLVDAGLPRRPPTVRLRFAQADLATLALGRSQAWYDRQDIVVIDGLAEHLPDRLVVSIARWATTHLRPGGHIVWSSLAATNDRHIVDNVLEWPLVRRSADELARVCGAGAGLRTRTVPCEDSGVVVVASRPAP